MESKHLVPSFTFQRACSHICYSCRVAIIHFPTNLVQVELEILLELLEAGRDFRRVSFKPSLEIGEF